MFINTITGTGVATSVWANTARTLTADPATDAGAAALVWARATRTLTADPTPLPTTSESNGTSTLAITTGNGSKGTYVQVIASTAAVSRALVICLTSFTTNQNHFFDIGVGPAASEVVVIANLLAQFVTSVGSGCLIYVVPIQIAAGSRIAIRGQASGLNTVGAQITIME